MDYKIVQLTDKPKIKERAARWFHEKWNIPLTAYPESMYIHRECQLKTGKLFDKIHGYGALPL